MPSIRTLFWIVALAFVVMWFATGEETEKAAAPQPERHRLHIRTVAGDTHTFAIEIARTWEEKRHGLMFRKHLPENQGMLFDFNYAQPLAMWMKDTYIPLDILFIGENGVIVSVRENAEPLSEHYISSPVPARAVLEIAGGSAKKYGIKIGDTVMHPIFHAMQ